MSPLRRLAVLSHARWLHTRPPLGNSIRALQDAFRDPTSPYHIPRGTQGPASPDEPTISAADSARSKLIAQGYDAASLWEQPIVWGDHDSFQHVNNVRYVRFFESGRMHWIMAVGHEFGGVHAAQKLLNAKGISFILKSIEVKFRRPVTFPDTLLIGHKPLPWPTLPSDGSDTRRGPPLSQTQFYLNATAYSYAQDAIVADSTSVITWYDYDKLSKCDPGDDMWAPVRARMNVATAITE